MMSENYTIELDNREVTAHNCEACDGDKVLAPVEKCQFCGDE